MKSIIPRVLPQLFILKNYCGCLLIDPTPLPYLLVWFPFLPDIVYWWGFTLRSWFGLLRFNFQHLFNLAFLQQFDCFVLSFILYIGSIFQLYKTLFLFSYIILITSLSCLNILKIIFWIHCLETIPGNFHYCYSISIIVISNSFITVIVLVDCGSHAVLSFHPSPSLALAI